MASKRSEMSKLHEVLAQVLKDEIQKDEPAPSALNVARQFLKDNGVECDPDRKPKSMDALVEAFDEIEDLPKFN